MKPNKALCTLMKSDVEWDFRLLDSSGKYLSNEDKLLNYITARDYRLQEKIKLFLEQTK